MEDCFKSVSHPIEVLANPFKCVAASQEWHGIPHIHMTSRFILAQQWQPGQVGITSGEALAA
jgi:hypothetical protein